MATANITEKDILKALEGVKDPDLGRDLTDLGMIKDVAIKGDTCSLTVELTTPACPLKDVIGKDVKTAITSRVPSIKKVDLAWSSSVRNSFPTGHDLLPGVKNVVLIGSGKGGVGKSTIAANVACALAQTGATVGVMDADIYGPSIPTIFGTEAPPLTTPDQRIIPVLKYGMRLMSMGFLLEDGQPVVWRGPMLDSALRQFLGQVAWGELDYLVIDLPPGTGDVQLSLSRFLPQASAVVVTTPQDVALADVKRAFNMFKQVNMKVLGIVENMSGFICSHCGERTDIFLCGGGRTAAEVFGIEFFGEVPLSADVVRMTDAGTPAVIEQPGGTFSVAVKGVAGRIAQALAIESTRHQTRPVEPTPQAGHGPAFAVPAGRYQAPAAAAAPAAPAGHGHVHPQNHGHHHEHGHSHGQGQAPHRPGGGADGFTRL